MGKSLCSTGETFATMGKTLCTVGNSDFVYHGHGFHAFHAFALIFSDSNGFPFFLLIDSDCLSIRFHGFSDFL